MNLTTPQNVASSYDDVQYDAGAVPGAHPDVLAVTGIMWGIEPPAVERCTVLELGCSTGENLLALAVALPDAHFHGIDASPAQIEAGQARLQALGVRNVRLECRRIEELHGVAERYDYILCHGVYSWVPVVVRQQIMAITAELLTPAGLAYISYNTQPGWHIRQQLRNLLLFHLGAGGEPGYRIAQARALLEFLAGTLRDRTDAYGAELRGAVELLRRESDPYLFHEFLEDVNEPEYLHEFVDRARRHGLQYIDDVLPVPDAIRSMPAARQTLAEGGADRIAMEQYIDFLAGRGFRRSVLCRHDVRLAQAPAEHVIPRLRIAAAVRPHGELAPVTSDAVQAFAFGGGQRIETNHPGMKTALAVLGSRYPHSVAFGELYGEVQARLEQSGAESPPDTRELLAGWLHQCYRSGLVELHVWQAPFTLEAAQRPVASPLARNEARGGSPLVTSLRHMLVMLQPMERDMLEHLDGSVDVAELHARLASQGHDVSADDVLNALRHLARSALLLK